MAASNYSQQQPAPQPEQIVVIPRSATSPAQTEGVGSRFKSFFKRDKKAKLVLSERDARILAKVKRGAKLMDTGINIGCARMGIDPIIGLVPFLGDFITLLLALNIVYTAQQADIPKSLTRRMIVNVALDFAMGLVPVLGDFADFLFKANDKNAKLFEAFLYQRAAEQAAEAEAIAARDRVATPPAVANPAGDSGAGRPLHQNNTAAPKASKSFFGRSRRHDQPQQEQEQHYQAQPYTNEHTAIEMEPVGVHPPVK